MSSSVLRLGIVGAGYVTEAYHLPVLRSMREVELTWLCDTNLSRAKELARMSGISGAHDRLAECPEVDVALVTVPPGARRAVMGELIPRHWHAFCEKPFASDLDEHRWIMTQARREGVRLTIGLVRRFYHSTQNARRLIGSRLLGPIEQIIAGEGQRVQKTGRGAGWYQADARASGGGVLAETGTHLIDQVFSICGVRSFDLQAVLQKEVNGLEFETTARSSLQLHGGETVPFAVTVSRLTDVFNGIVIRCKNGEIRLAVGPDSPVEIRDRSGHLASRVASPIPGLAALSAAVRAEWQAFLLALGEGPEFEDEDTGWTSAAFIDACYRRGARSAVSTGEAHRAEVLS